MIGKLLMPAALALLLTAAAATANSPARSCPLPPQLLPDEPVAPLTVARLAGGEPVTIIALGSASTAGRAAGSADRTWPARLAAALTVRYPAARIEMINRGAAGTTADDMVHLFDREVLPLAPTLVIWETGTVDAARGLDVDGFHEALQDGIDRLQAGGVEVVLMDMQFSRFTEILISFERYAGEMRDIATTNGVGLFPRRDLMRHWAETGALDYAAREPSAQTSLARQVYDCLGRALADFLSHGTAAPAVTK